MMKLRKVDENVLSKFIVKEDYLILDGNEKDTSLVYTGKNKDGETLLGFMSVEDGVKSDIVVVISESELQGYQDTPTSNRFGAHVEILRQRQDVFYLISKVPGMVDGYWGESSDFIVLLENPSEIQRILGE